MIRNKAAAALHASLALGKLTTFSQSPSLMQRCLSLVIKATHKFLNLSSSSSASPTLFSVALASPPSVTLATMELVDVHQRWVRQLIEKNMFPIFGHMLKDRSLGFGSLHDWDLDPDSDQFTLPSSELPRESDHPLPSLCNACKNINMKALEQDLGYMHSRDVNDFILSAKWCPLCKLIQRQLCAAVKYHIQRDEKIVDVSEAVELFAALMAAQDYFLVHPTPVILKLDDSRRGAFLEDLVAIGTFATTPARSTEIVLMLFWGRLELHGSKDQCQLPLLPRGSDDELLERLRLWLHVRESEVPSWSDAADDKLLPTRLLDLDVFGCDDDKAEGADLRLVETAGQYGKYAALSYCWGGYTAGRTLKEIYSERCRKIEFVSLAPLFAQAVKVTRGLGMRYLWIDSFCIVQDDAEDWRREAAAMSDVYSNTSCRIAVNDCKSPLENFFPPPLSFSSVKVPGLIADASFEEGGDNEHDMNPREALDDGPDWSHDEDEALQEAIAMSLQDDEEEAFHRAIPTSLQDSFNQLGRDHAAGNGQNIEPPRLPVEVDAEGSAPTSAIPQNDRMTSDVRLGPMKMQPPKPAIFVEDDNFITRLPPNDGETELSGLVIEPPEQTYDFPDHANDPSEHLRRSSPSNTGFAGDVDLPEFIPCTRNKGKGRQQPECMYLSLLRAYTLDVDRGNLNTRAWVLQERLLATRTIHFTSEHIYCEDQDDICGEDWVRRYFTWMSCIDKSSVLSPINLFPARSFTTDHRNSDFDFDRLWWMRSLYCASETHHVPDPWLRICEKYSRCSLSVATDRLAAFAGLVKRYPSDKPSMDPNERNLLGLWESNLHIELLWYATTRAKLKYRQDLNLPSWAWIAYDGRIFFTKDARNRRDSKTVEGAPVPEFILAESNVPDMMTVLPLEEPATLTICVNMRSMGSISQEPTEFQSEDCPRDEVMASSPFNFDPRTGTVPIALADFSICRDVFDQAGRRIGFISFDEEGTTSDNLCCAHISTLYDEARGEAYREFDDPSVTRVDMNRFRTPILAYGLVLIKVKESEDKFRRVGICEVRYDWISDSEQTMIRLL